MDKQQTELSDCKVQDATDENSEEFETPTRAPAARESPPSDNSDMVTRREGPVVGLSVEKESLSESPSPPKSDQYRNDFDSPKSREMEEELG